MIASDAAARAAGDSAAVAPAVRSGATFAGVRFQTVTVCPWPSRRVAMADPMRPVPAIPTFTTLLLCTGGAAECYPMLAHRGARHHSARTWHPCLKGIRRQRRAGVAEC